ncbi:prenyltransferase [Planctomycetes bacterium Poly30]|uniref:Prenyltransferase n=1 Tax=Saltatorellus ferox TaxID=2528018 RepID=A0A518ETG7_9BACT|nr:prenyltransferase [Planctomycetes bacterium Poly30]
MSGRRSRRKPDEKDRTASGESSGGPDRSNPIIAFGQLIRVALGFSALSDVFVGVAIGFGAQWPGTALPWLLIPASLGVYHGAMALNDWSDREEDARVRPERPIPSGAIPASMALGLASMLILGGIFWAFGAGPRAGVWMAVVAALAVLYDLAGRGEVRGPLLLGLCRAGNLGAGLMSPWLVGLVDSPSLPLLGLSAVYGAHVFFIGRLGRLEDEEDQRPLGHRPSRALRGIALTAMAVPIAGLVALSPGGNVLRVGELGFPAAAGLAACAAIAAWNATVLLKRAAELDGSNGWTRGTVGASTGLSLRRLPLFTASIAAMGMFMGPAASVAGIVALVGARMSGAMRKVFPLT